MPHYITIQENERNDYLLADPVQTLEEFLTIARESLFPRGLNPEWAEVCTDNRYMVYPPSVQEDVPEIGTDQQTLKTEQGVWDSVLTQLQLSVPANTFAVFRQGTELLSITDGVATIGTNRSHACEWLQVQMAPRIKKVLAVELSARGDQIKVSAVRCGVTTD
jgi:hypothetical protein